MKRIVTIGGGTGSFTLLSGIKNIPNLDLKAIVTMTDNGGSTGVLRDELGVLPPGDVRQCLVALSKEDKVMRDLMNYRFDGGTLSGHNFGNIFLAGLEKVTGDFATAVEFIGNILKIQGKVIPITNQKAHLKLKLKNGEILEGENKISNFDLQNIGIEKIFIENAKINEQAKKAILNAEYIFIGPGNHFCSIVPNLIVKGNAESFKNTKAKIIYISNMTNKKGHSTNYKLSDYVQDIEKYIGRKLDKILVNNKKPNKKQLNFYKKYIGENALVENDMQDDKRIVLEDILSTKVNKPDKNDKIASQRAFIRHDSKKLATVVENKILKN